MKRQGFGEGGGQRRKFGGGGMPPRGGNPNRRDFGGRDDYRPRRDFGGPGRSEGGNSFGDERPPRRTWRNDEGPQGGYGAPPPRRPRSFDGPPPRERASMPHAAPPAAPAISANKLKAGIKEANRALAEVIEHFGESLEGPYDISELEVPVSFAADGRFMGLGAGGALSMKLTITPLGAEEIIDAEAKHVHEHVDAPEPVTLAAGTAEDDELQMGESDAQAMVANAQALFEELDDAGDDDMDDLKAMDDSDAADAMAPEPAAAAMPPEPKKAKSAAKKAKGKKSSKSAKA